MHRLFLLAVALAAPVFAGLPLNFVTHADCMRTPAEMDLHCGECRGSVCPSPTASAFSVDSAVWVNAYRPDLFDALSHFDDIRDLPETVAPFVEELLHIIAYYGMEKDVGVSLLHKHFNLNPDEILLELPFGLSGSVPAPGAQMSGTAPHRIDTAPSDILPYMFTFDDLMPIPLEFTVNSTSLERKLQNLRANGDFVTDFVAILERTGMVGVLGFQILHRPDVTMETCDDEGRQITTNVAPMDLNCGADPADCACQVLWTAPAMEKLTEDARARDLVGIFDKKSEDGRPRHPGRRVP